VHATSGSQVWSQNKESVYHFPNLNANIQSISTFEICTYGHKIKMDVR